MASKTPRGDREKKKYSVRGEGLGQARREALTYLLVSSYLAPRIKCSHRILTHRSLAPVHCRGTMVLLYVGLGLGGTSCTSCMFVNVNCAMATPCLSWRIRLSSHSRSVFHKLGFALEAMTRPGGVSLAQPPLHADLIIYHYYH